MRCKKHFIDLSSMDGVCASCLRERLFLLIEAQAQAEVQAQAREDHQKSYANPPQVQFPRSVSPYISCRKSDNFDAWTHHGHSLSDQRFYSTPQVGPNGGIIPGNLYRKKQGKFSLFSNLFRSKTHKFDLDLKSRESYSTASLPTTASSPAWFLNILPGKRKKKLRMCTVNNSNPSRVAQRPCRGLSPAIESDDECREGSSGCTLNSSPGWKETPQRAAPPILRTCRRLNQARNGSGLAFCLSPLVRASPNRHWNQKGIQPEIAIPGEVRVLVKPHLGVASAFCANRSRKLANFGRFHPNY